METLDLHDHHRMDDDGAPPSRDHLAGRIGICMAVPPPVPPPPPAEAPPAAPEPPDDPTTSWKSYAAWRRTKCPLRNLDDPEERLVEIGHAVAEFVGEVAEVAEILAGRSIVEAMSDDVLRARLIDECGDVIFCGFWALDAWGENPLAECGPDVGLALLTAHEADAYARAVAGTGLEPRALTFMASQLGLGMGAQAGLLCNSYKKLRFQRRAQDTKLQATRVLDVFAGVAFLLALAGARQDEAVRANVAKINARYPNGSNSDGGIRG